MAEETKPVEVPKDVAAPAAEPAVEAKPLETTEPVAAPATTEAAPVVEAPATTTETPAPAVATETVEEAPAATTAVEEVKKEEVVPVEEGQLEHKGLNFPKNFIYSKQFFWFGSDAVEPKSLSHYRRSEKSAEAGHHNTAWASHTGKGLLFFGEKSAPVGVINLADATEPTTEGPTKFNFTSKGNKHAFKAANAADRDNWVSQLKLKIAEAKELATTITEAETYKSTLESFKPAAPVKKEEPVAAAPAETTEAAAAPVEAPAAVPTIETPPAVAEETPKEAPKERRSASRKRQSIFGSFFGQKEESKKEDKATEAVSPGTEAPAPVEAAPAAAEPVVAPAPVEAAAPVAEAPATTEAVAEDKPVEKKEEKPVPTKRNSIFGVFGKKEKKAADAAAAEPAKETEAPVTSETAPALPPVETSTPLGEAVADATPAAVEAPKEEAAPATNGETKKDVKAEKRKSSLPFAFGKKDKSPSTSDEEGDKPEKTGPFSKLRATIKARGRSEKPVEKPEEKTEEKPAEVAPAAEASTSTEPAAEPAVKPTEETANKPAAAVPAAPVVTAAA